MGQDKGYGNNENNQVVNSPKPGDGTQNTRKHADSAWYGPWQEPREEFSENSPRPADPDERRQMAESTSEGRPTFSGLRQPIDQASEKAQADERAGGIATDSADVET